MEISKKEKMLWQIGSFLPHKIVLSKLSGTQVKDYEVLNATLLYSDISGFTSMSEKLASMGKEGSEELNRIINDFFGNIIQIVYKWQGDIYRFGGDSVLSFFPEEMENLPSSQRAMNAAVEIVNFVKRREVVKTRVGSFKIRIHSSLTKGNIFFKDLKTDYFLGGENAFNLIRINDYAGPGEIVVDESVKVELKDTTFVQMENGVLKCELSEFNAKEPLKIERKIQVEGLKEKFSELKSYIPEWLFKKIELKPDFDSRDGEHRKVAIVFLHFYGIPYDREPQRASFMLNNFYSVLTETLNRYDGWLNKIDVYKDCGRVVVVFGFPRAHEDDKKRATLFAYDLLTNPRVKGIKIKGGINAGSVFIAPIGSKERREYAVMGDAVNLSARLAAYAVDGAILVSKSIFKRTSTLFDYKFLGEREYKGKRGKIATYKLVRKRQIPRSVLKRWVTESTKLVGRDREIKIIREKVRLVKKSMGQIVGISGKAGIGKTRLTQEVTKELKKEGFVVFRGNCLSYGSYFSYHPWVEILNVFFNIQPYEPLDVRRRKIKEKVAEIDEKLVEWLPVIGEIMGITFPETSLTKYLDAKLKKQRIFDIIFDIFKYITKSKPVSIVIEDAHWADNVSLELINYIGRNIKDLPILLLIVYRPLKRKEEFMEKEFTTLISLKELSKDNSLELIESLLNIHGIYKDFIDLILNKSQGNPFYIEELIKSLIEQGYIVHKKGGWEFKGNIKKVNLPDTVESVILSRIDRLDLPLRDVLQVASVLGKEFDEFLIKGIYPDAKLLDQSLKELQRFDLIREERGKGNVRYIFKHIMTQEVAYDTLSYARKRELHRKTGTYIEDKLKDRKEEFLGLLSYHFYKGEDYDKSLLYSVEAGEKAKKVYDNNSAIEFFTRAIESYEKLEKLRIND